MRRQSRHPHHSQSLISLSFKNPSTSLHQMPLPHHLPYPQLAYQTSQMTFLSLQTLTARLSFLPLSHSLSAHKASNSKQLPPNLSRHFMRRLSHSPSAASSIISNFNFSIPDLSSLDIPPTKEEEEQLFKLTQPLSGDLQIPHIDSQSEQQIITENQDQLEQSASQISPAINTTENTPNFPPATIHSPIPFPEVKQTRVRP